jgi:uncharacterized Ntn-hydrolase superfamily protein
MLRSVAANIIGLGLLASGLPWPALADPPPTGTFSIVARDSITGELGVAVQSRAFNVGQRVAWAEAGVGAIVTQASTNVSFGPRGLALLETGLDASTVQSLLLESDPGRANRQLGIVDARGGTSGWTGEQCMDWAGDQSGPGFTCQGNILAGEPVVAAMVRAYAEASGTLAERADHPAPIEELRRIYEMSFANHLAGAYLELADEHEAAGRPELAAVERGYVAGAIQRALDEGNMDAASLNGLAWMTATRDLFLPEALQAAERADELEPNSAEVLDTLAEVYWRMGEFDEAVRVGRRALDVSPGDAYLQSQLEKFEESRLRGTR